MRERMLAIEPALQACERSAHAPTATPQKYKPRRLNELDLPIVGPWLADAASTTLGLWKLVRAGTAPTFTGHAAS
jgi:hypothetical protein